MKTAAASKSAARVSGKTSVPSVAGPGKPHRTKSCARRESTLMKVRSSVAHRFLTSLALVSALASPAHASAFALTLPLAQIPTSLKTSVEFALGVVFLFGFIWGVVKIWTGADRMSKGDADGKMGIVSGIIIAGAAAIMGAFFTIFGMGGGVLTPQF